MQRTLVAALIVLAAGCLGPRNAAADAVRTLQRQAVSSSSAIRPVPAATCMPACWAVTWLAIFRATRHLPQNMLGAGSIRAANYVYTVAAKDGLTIGSINRSVPLAPLLGDGKEQIQFDPLQCGWSAA
jgi:hypothetical protein